MVANKLAGGVNNRGAFLPHMCLARIFQCAVETEQDSRGRENPTRQLSLRRKQLGRRSPATAAAEAPDVKGSNSESASEQVLI